MTRSWTKGFTPRMLQELNEAEYYVSKFGTENTYASHMILMAVMAKMLDENTQLIEGYKIELTKADKLNEDLITHGIKKLDSEGIPSDPTD